jgi:hypothetical protein
MPIKAVAIRANSVVNPGSSLRRRQYDRPANIATPAKATADNKGETICDTAPAKAATMNDRSPAALRSGPCPLRRSRSSPISSPAPSATAKPICWGVKNRSNQALRTAGNQHMVPPLRGCSAALP